MATWSDNLDVELSHKARFEILLDALSEHNIKGNRYRFGNTALHCKFYEDCINDYHLEFGYKKGLFNYDVAVKIREFTDNKLILEEYLPIPKKLKDIIDLWLRRYYPETRIEIAESHPEMLRRQRLRMQAGAQALRKRKEKKVKREIYY